jgi:hypothetical protein
MQYNGPNESGLNVKDAIENKINEEYPDKKYLTIEILEYM